MSQYLSVPWSTHYAAVLRILRYLKGTLFHSLFYSAQSPLVLRAFSDADWAGDPTDRRSTTGYCFLLGSSLISWRSKKQTFVACFSIEAEYRALTDTTSELLWLRWLLTDLGVSTSSATPLYCDNQSAIHIAHNDVFHERTKHIEIDCHFIRYHLVHGALKLFSVSSKDQLADIFTKSLPKGRTRDLVDNLKLVSHPPWVWGGAVNVYYVLLWALGPTTFFTCIAHLYLYYTLLVPHTYASYIRQWCIFFHSEIQYNLPVFLTVRDIKLMSHQSNYFDHEWKSMMVLSSYLNEIFLVRHSS